MLRTISFFVIFWFYQILILPWLLYALILRARGRDQQARELAGRVATRWARFLMWIAGARVHLRSQANAPTDQAVLYVSNHQGAFDIPLCLSLVPGPIGFMAKKELAGLPSIGTWMGILGCVFVDRGNRRLAMQSLDEAVRTLRRGGALMVFPEGTRSNSDEMKVFKAGFVRIAQRAEVPIVPVVMKGTYRLKMGDTPWITPADVEVAIESPISVETLRDRNVHEVARLVQNVIQRRLDAGDCASPSVLKPSENPA